MVRNLRVYSVRTRQNDYVIGTSYAPMPIRIETDRLVLELRGPEDATWNLELRHESDHPASNRLLAEEAEYLSEQRAQAHVDGFGFLTIRRRIEGDPIGYVGLLVGRASFDEPELAYELLRRAHGHGYATEAAQAVLDAAFKGGRVRVWSTVRSWNAASLRVLDKLGFRRHHVTADKDGDLIWLVFEHS
jgi:RimJ/RimL family protein N-acetyltransferase